MMPKSWELSRNNHWMEDDKQLKGKVTMANKLFRFFRANFCSSTNVLTELSTDLFN